MQKLNFNETEFFFFIITYMQGVTQICWIKTVLEICVIRWNRSCDLHQTLALFRYHKQWNWNELPRKYSVGYHCFPFPLPLINHMMYQHMVRNISYCLFGNFNGCLFTYVSMYISTDWNETQQCIWLHYIARLMKEMKLQYVHFPVK